MRRRAAGFTLIELMVVLVIIALLIGLLIPALRTIRTKAKETSCKDHLHNIHLALTQYHNDHEPDGDWFPYRLTYLYDTYIDDPKVFLCPFDRSKGLAGSRKDGKFPETYESGALANTKPCSYMYEFSGAQCTWTWQGYVGKGMPATATLTTVDRDGDGVGSWGEVKWVQYKDGDVWLHQQQQLNGQEETGWPGSIFPIVRCFWEQDDINSEKEQHVLNQSMEGRPFWSGATWEKSYRN
jgi:prepilin-type N-terminal cleavage/methylation domain-containing protein